MAIEITLKALRVNKNLTQKDVASEIGVSKRTLANWENAKTFPDVPNIKKIETFYGVRYDDINFYV